MTRITTLALLLFTAIQSNAQKITELDSVVIHENRIETKLANRNRDIQVLTSRQIALLPVKSTAELLSYVAGADLRKRGPWGAQADISIDGSSFDQVLVLVNGVKMSDPQTGHHLMNLPIVLSAIDHIEVLRGPAARVYGINALAGVVNIITRIPTQNEVSAQVYTGSSFAEDTSTGEQYYSYGAQATAGIAAKNQSHQFSIGHDKGNGYRYNTAFEATRLFYNNQLRLNERNTIEVMGGYVANDFGAALYYAAPNDKEATENVETATGSIKYTYQLTDRIKLSPRISYRYNKDDYIYIRQKPEVYHNIHETNVVTGELQSSITTRNGVVGLGAEYRKEDINSTNLGKRERANTGLFGEYRHNFSSKLNASAGVYANHNSDYGWQVFPSVDAGYQLSRHWRLFANASTGQRLPTYTDLYYKGPSNIGNDQLKPEHASYANGGVAYSHHLVTAQASYFYRRTTNFIDWVKDSLAGKWQPQNFQDVNTNGLSLQVNYALGQSLTLPDNYQITINAAYTYLDASIQTPAERISKYTIDALRHQLITSVQTVLFKRVQINANGRYQYRISGNDYTLLDARVALLFKHWNIYADCNNLLDTDYKELGAVPLPGRWYTIGLRLNFK
jgi:vitamin B12 transporter